MTYPLPLISDDFKFEQIEYPDRMEDIGRFRIVGWREEKGVDPDFFAQDVWIDKIDQRACHWIVTVEEKIIAVARLSLHTSLLDVPYAEFVKPRYYPLFENRKIASLNRLVVAPGYRGRGLSSALDRIRIEYARSQNAEKIIAFPQLVRIEPLKRRGFVMVEELESIPEMPERPFFLMEMDLKKQ